MHLDEVFSKILRRWKKVIFFQVAFFSLCSIDFVFFMYEDVQCAVLDRSRFTGAICDGPSRHES